MDDTQDPLPSDQVSFLPHNQVFVQEPDAEARRQFFEKVGRTSTVGPAVERILANNVKAGGRAD